MTATIKVEVDETLARRFKKKAFENYGYKKGAMKKALEELMRGYADQREKADWNSFRGVLKNQGEFKSMNSVEVQHSIWRLRNDSHRLKRVS